MPDREVTAARHAARDSHAGRRVLVTGAAKGIGLALAEAFARRGAVVGVLDIDAAEVAAAVAGLPGQGVAMTADVGDYDALAEAIAKAEAEIGGGFDALINNAGISPKHQGRAHKVWEMDPAEWRRVVDVNLTGTFNGVRALAPGMIERGGGSIVNTSSVAGKTFFPIVASHYAATKSAIIGLTKHWAGELGPHGIRVNALAPGRIATPMVNGVAPEVNAAEVARTPLGRLGEPAEVADVALWLTSPEASFVTGQTIDVAGGLCM
ncbi:3-oxoacyl-ACP reductase FabG [Roseivivax sp. CAU 1761]